MREGEGGGMRGEKLSVKEEGRGYGREIGLDLDLDHNIFHGSRSGNILRILWIRIGIHNTALNM